MVLYRYSPYPNKKQAMADLGLDMDFLAQWMPPTDDDTPPAEVKTTTTTARPTFVPPSDSYKPIGGKCSKIEDNL